MPLFNRAAYNYGNEPIQIPTDIPKYKETSNKSSNITVIVPSFVISISQSIISFILRKSSRLPFIGTKNGEIREFEIDELHIILLTLCSFATYYTRKYRKESKQNQWALAQLMRDSKIHNFETLAAIDHNNVKRIECIYYKNQFQLYDIDLLTRTELRSFIHQILKQCELLSGLTIKILETFNNLTRRTRKQDFSAIYHSRLNSNKNRSNSVQQRLRMELRNKQTQIDEEFDRQMEIVDKFQSFFDEKNNEQYLVETRDQELIKTKKEILDGYKDQNEQKQIEINNAKKLAVMQNKEDNDDQKMTEQDDDDDENHLNESPLQKRRKSIQLQMNYDHEYLVKQADNLPIQQIDFSSRYISRYNLQKQVNQMKYDIIMNQDEERKREKIRKYGIVTFIVAATTFSYWYNRHYQGKGVAQRIRDTKARFFSYF